MFNNSLQDPLSAEEVAVFSALKGTALALLIIWTVAANCLVFVVLYKNPRLQTVPNLLVGNLAFSDLCLGSVVLPLSAIYAISEHWLFGGVTCEIWLSADILCCTASIWNLSMIGLDRYWAITSPITYMNKRNKRSGAFMISCVWFLSALISLAPFFGWKQQADFGNHRFDNITQTWQCLFLDLPAYTVYSATGSFFLPTLVMFFVYTKIYQAFAAHRARQIYRQKVIRKHIESTILHEISHVLPTSDEFAKSDDDLDDDESDEDDSNENPPIIEEDEDRCVDELEEDAVISSDAPQSTRSAPTPSRSILVRIDKRPKKLGKRVSSSSKSSSVRSKRSSGRSPNSRTPNSIGGVKISKKSVRITTNSNSEHQPFAPRESRRKARMEDGNDRAVNFDRVMRHKNRREKRAGMRKSLQKKPAAISAAKERRGVKVLGIILGCFLVCWTPFFVMYLVAQFCEVCRPDVHVDQFITWLGYSNSAMNPIIYTVFNRDYQTALKRLFTGQPAKKK